MLGPTPTQEQFKAALKRAAAARFDSLDVSQAIDSVLDAFSEHFFGNKFEDLSLEDRRRILTAFRNQLTEQVAMTPKLRRKR